MGDRTTWLAVVAYAAGMAWVESAAVIYLRHLVGRIEPYQPNPLPIAGTLGWVELVREAATLVMLAAVGWLAGREGRRGFAYTCIAFGVWDILYYAFLRMMAPWPRSVWDWDILFLMPLPWWGPVAAPTSIALLMIAGGTLVTQLPSEGGPRWPRPVPWRLGLVGAGLALYVFMADAVGAAGGGVEALSRLLPAAFNWPLFSVALVLMAAPVLDILIQVRTQAQGVLACESGTR
jgi:hypothetical protein